jgi:hypothetical protein
MWTATAAACRVREKKRRLVVLSFSGFFLSQPSCLPFCCLPSILCKHEEKRSVQTQVKRQDVTKDCTTSLPDWKQALRSPF